MPSFQQKKSPAEALKETKKGEIYKLSTINDSGVYLPPSPCEDSKRDHWIELDEDIMAFRLPSPECLTAKTQPHSFFTPSASLCRAPTSRTATSASDGASESDVPSLITDNS
ncbi:hypothetical protein BCR43DRAFT_496774 [Syncephalastrum racemosum]|uniref:Uncharacterized protein n=1 Tax=Syncephalastrum racemosum TaxID=13706 RepID=A0A1X2H4L9_SYNRA|nr:hypothetical protein BCR43DRAFT_496774 [Syncephalastrum racemosum]